ncbi:hypothetical protein BZG84_13510 [Salinivibrio sp. PR932]|uniref:outer membrane beta-barrel protein n=1 Tax=Salinivibrio sp. PR932 TaxID=1909492 RepID=UPI0009895430|nr:outer membrane beta-barrel protein [Salinivibrio sp. PR932]OOF14910.1 hypothetical protein BZG84_13510 [Salinivibrio sp. PR932]
MMSKKFKILFFGALTSAAFIANAEENTDYQYFVGFDAGTNISGKQEITLDGSKHKFDIDNSPIVGLRGGVTYNNTHQFSLGIDYRSIDREKFDYSDTEVATIYTRYDYLLPLTNNISWNIGGKVGYEEFFGDWQFDDFNHEMSDMVLGAQTGLNYKFDQWSVGAELNYLHHTGEYEYEDSGVQQNVKFGDELMLMANVKYHL